MVTSLAVLIEQEEYQVSEQDEDGGIQMQMDQLESHLISMAKTFGTYFKQLRNEGFSRDEAMEMVLELQDHMIPDTNKL